MTCCEQCFLSGHLKFIVRSASTSRGNCDSCGARDVRIANTLSLAGAFEPLLLEYQIAEDYPEATVLIEQLNADFADKIFSRSMLRNKEFLGEIIAQSEEIDPAILKSKVILRHKLDASLRLKSDDLRKAWLKFSEEIKTRNRFHLTNVLDLNELGRLLKRYEQVFEPGEIFFRGRISPRYGFEKSKMWNPAGQDARAGRANPHGISYLYLANDVKTTLYETRAQILDYITVATFKLNRQLRVVDLNRRDFDPLYLAENESLQDFLVHADFMNLLGTELSRAVRRIDNELDYLPTQYLCEFIKSLSYDGVKYVSSLNAEGYNVAVFYPEKFQLTNTELHEVRSVEYIADKIVSDKPSGLGGLFGTLTRWFWD